MSLCLSINSLFTVCELHGKVYVWIYVNIRVCVCVCSCVGGTAGERSSSGLLEWESVNDAMEGLAMMNHYQMKNPSKYLPGCCTILYCSKFVMSRFALTINHIFP